MAKSDPAQVEMFNHAVRAYRSARQAQVSAELVASDALFTICAAVIQGTVSMRRAAYLARVPKTTLARLVERARQQDWPAVEVSYLDADAYVAAYTRAWGAQPEQVPFVWETDAEGQPAFRWL